MIQKQKIIRELMGAIIKLAENQKTFLGKTMDTYSFVDLRDEIIEYMTI